MSPRSRPGIFSPLFLAVPCLALFCFTGNLHAQHFTRLYSVGDSLTDAGTYAPTTQLTVPGSGRFTTNPGGVWTQYLGASLGLSSSAAIVNNFGMASRTPNGGTNYAQGGSRVSRPAAPVAGAPWFTADPVSGQIDRLLADAGSVIDPRALLTVSAGANDMLTQYAAVGAGLSVSIALGEMSIAANDLSLQIARLQAAGAKFVIVHLLPDIGSAPIAGLQGPQGAALLQSLTQTFNAQLLADTQGRNVLVFDAARLFGDVIARPAAYGFTAASASSSLACGAVASLVCVNAPNAATFIFADSLHPTSAMHAVLAQATLSVLRAPGQNAMLVTAPMGALRRQSQQADQRMSLWTLGAAQNNPPPSDSGIGFFADVQGESLRTASDGIFAGAEGHTRSGTVGADMQLSPAALVGVSLSHEAGRTSFSSDTGGFTSRSTTGRLYGAIALGGNWFANASAAVGQVDFDAIDRNDYLGATQLKLTSTGNTQGRLRQLRAGVSYVVREGAFAGGPSLSYTHEQVRIEGYTENASPLSLSFGDARYTVRRLSLGFSGAIDLPVVQPFARISLERDLEKAPLQASIGSFSTHRMNVAMDRPDTSFMLAAVGVRGRVSRSVQWSLVLNTTLNHRNLRGGSIGAGVQFVL